VAGPDGNVWFTEYYGTRIGRIPVTGTIPEFPLSGSNPQPHDNEIWNAQP